MCAATPQTSADSTAGAHKKCLSSLSPLLSNPSAILFIIDTDAFLEKREAFSLENIRDRLSTFHDEIIESFNVTVTSFALKEWE